MLDNLDKHEFCKVCLEAFGFFISKHAHTIPHKSSTGMLEVRSFEKLWREDLAQHLCQSPGRFCRPGSVSLTRLESCWIWSSVDNHYRVGVWKRDCSVDTLQKSDDNQICVMHAISFLKAVMVYAYSPCDVLPVLKHDMKERFAFTSKLFVEDDCSWAMSSPNDTAFYCNNELTNLCIHDMHNVHRVCSQKHQYPNLPTWQNDTPGAPKFAFGFAFVLLHRDLHLC